MRPKNSVLTSTIMSLRQFICNVFALETIVSIGLGFFFFYLFVYLVGNSVEGQTWDKGNSRQMFLPSLPLLIFNFHKFKPNINNKILILKQAEIIEHLNLALYFTQFSRLDF